MTWRTWMWGGPFLLWFFVLSAPMLAMLIPINLADDQSQTERLVGNLVLVGAFLLLVPMHNWITIRPGKVRLGFFPLYWKTLEISEIRYAMPVEFKPMRDFAGWGIKGLAKSRNGILLGGNPSRGIMIETHDKRRYVMSFVDSGPVLRALEAQGCTLAAGIDDVLSGEV